MSGAEMHHRTGEFRELYRQVIADLHYFMDTGYDVMVLTASGTGAMEAAVSNLFSPGEKVLVCTAGKFGERWVEMTRAFGLEAQVLEAPYGDAVSPERVAEALRADAEIQGVFVQATESSTGVSHDVRVMAEEVGKSDAVFVVDAITGLGTSQLEIDGWGLDVVIGGSQKAAMVPPGLAFLSVSPKAWERAESHRSSYYYFDLLKHKKSGEKGESPWTPAISLLLGLAESLRYIRTIGRENLIENARLLAQATRAAAEGLDLALFAKATPAGALTSIRAPRGIDSSDIVKEFKTQFGSIIANGQGSMKGEIFRIAHLGYFDFADLFAVVAELEIILKSLGHPVELGAGVRRVQQVYMDAR